MNPEFLVCVLPVMFITFIMGGCTSDPYAPVNQSTPIRQMDHAFDPSGSRTTSARPRQSIRAATTGRRRTLAIDDRWIGGLMISI